MENFDENKLKDYIDKLENSNKDDLRHSITELSLSMTRLTILVEELEKIITSLEPRVRSLEITSHKAEELVKLEPRIRELEKSSINNEVTLKAIRLLAGIIVTSVIGIIVTLIFQKILSGG